MIRGVNGWARCGAAVLAAMALAGPALAQDAPDGAKLFTAQCGTCHTLHASDPQRQGPTLEHVWGRKIGAVETYKYTAGYREAGAAGQVWGEDNLDAYVANPQKVFPGSTMAYRQSKAETRKAIIAFLKDQ